MFDMIIDETRAPVLDRRLVSIVDRQSFEAEQFRRIRNQIETLAETRGVRVVAVTSAASHEGKTTTAINVAASLAQARQSRVLLIDADLRRPAVGRSLRLDPEQNGLLHLLDCGGGDLAAHVLRVPGTTLDVLTCERSRHDAYEVLTSPALRAVVQRARELYAHVVVDTPPALPVPDNRVIGRLVDGYLVVVAANATPRKLLGEALNLLEAESVLGLVFNRDVRPLFGYYDSYKQSYFRPRAAVEQRAEA